MLWYILAGLVLCAMAFASSLIRRLPLTTAVVYLALGFFVGPQVSGILTIDLVAHASFLERTAEIVLLVSLFSAGLKIPYPLLKQLWGVPFRLAFLSMILTAGMIVSACAFLLHIPWSVSILLGAALSPTDPVLASDIDIERPFDPTRLRFAFTSEAGLNDGLVFPLILMGLMLMNQNFETGALGQWSLMDLLWETAGGVGMGALIGTTAGRLIFQFNTLKADRSGGLEFFLTPGLIALSYGLSHLIHGNAFLACFGTAIALRRMDWRATGKSTTESPAKAMAGQDTRIAGPGEMIHSMIELLLRFSIKLEQMGEIIIVVIIGSLLSVGMISAGILLTVFLIFFVIRPAASITSLVGSGLNSFEKKLIAWFGIRGIGSFYYLVYASLHGLDLERYPETVHLVLIAISVSIMMHGISVTPLMTAYFKAKQKK